jgi:hypothetical protein
VARARGGAWGGQDAGNEAPGRICNKHGGYEDANEEIAVLFAHRALHLGKILCPNDHDFSSKTVLFIILAVDFPFDFPQDLSKLESLLARERTQVH